MQALISPLLIICTLLLSNNALALSQVTATVDKNPAMINESILLTVTADDDISRNALDTRALLADFIVGQTSVSSQTSMVNFKTTRLTKWQVILIARRAGTFTIPAFSINNHQSAPFQISVKTQNKQDTTIQPDIFVTSALSTNQIYVQQSLTLSIKLHYSIELKSGSITEPNLAGATIEKAGKDKQTDNIINGKRYRVIEQTYAITPEQSGELTLQAPVFSGEVLQASKRQSSFLSFSQSKPVSILGEALTISVLPIPIDYPDNTQWLPTDILTLHQEWQSGGKEFTVGEPITRTLTITGSGLSKSQLPKLEMKNSRGLKVYPDQAELHSNIINERLVSQKVQNFALVPSAAGEFVLPEMSITWFNTITNKIAYASLPAQTITVKPAENYYTGLPNDHKNQAQQTIQQMQDSQKTSNQEDTFGSALNEDSLNNISSQKNEDKRLQWLFLGLWILTVIAWISHVILLKRMGKKTGEYAGNKSNKASQSTFNGTGNYYADLLSACKKNNAEQTLSLVLPWLKEYLATTTPTLVITTISQGKTYIHDQTFISALNELQQHLYGKNAVIGAPAWQGAVLRSAIQEVNSQKHDQTASSMPLQLNP